MSGGLAFPTAGISAYFRVPASVQTCAYFRSSMRFQISARLTAHEPLVVSEIRLELKAENEKFVSEEIAMQYVTQTSQYIAGLARGTHGWDGRGWERVARIRKRASVLGPRIPIMPASVWRGRTGVQGAQFRLRGEGRAAGVVQGLPRPLLS
jgi:hypothetical protein